MGKKENMIIVINETEIIGHYIISLHNNWYRIFISKLDNTMDIKLCELKDIPSYAVDLLLTPPKSSHLGYIIKNKNFYNIIKKLFPDLDLLYEIYYIKKKDYSEDDSDEKD